MVLFCVFLGVAIFAETSFLCWKSLRKTKSSSRRKIFVDTSALMDGRVLDVARTGFISDDMVIPRSVIRELQLLADGKDHEKRTRARQGMDAANELERIEFFNVEILQDELDRTPVDERLLELAKKERGAAILTCDYNLEKVATTEHIDVLNVNALALTLQSDYQPGDKINIKISARGQNPGQGLGYLPDGTMVVVNDAASKIGKQVTVELERHMQTAAGRMMFAHQTKATRKKSSR